MLTRKYTQKAYRRNAVVPRFDEDDALARKFMRRFRMPFMRAAENLNEAADLWSKQAAEGSWNGAVAIRDLPWDSFYDELLAGTLRSVGVVFDRSLDKELDESFDIKISTKKQIETAPALPEALAFEYVQSYGAQLVEGITLATEAALQEILAQMITEFKAPAEMARQIKNVIGLTDKWAKAVLNFEDRLVAEGVSGPDLKKKVDRYRKKLIRARAERIARTETIRSRNAGIQAAWNIAVSEGELDPTAGKIWLAKNPCEICIELANLAPVPMNEPFMSPDLGPIMTPPAHPNCKCGIGLVDIDRGLGRRAQRLRTAAQTGDRALTNATAQQIQREIERELSR